MRVDRYAKDLSKKLDGFSNGNGNGNGNGLAKDYDDDDDYCIAIGSEPLRFAAYRHVRAKKKIGDCLTFEDVYDSITQDELDYYLKAKLTVSPEERYQKAKKNFLFHDLSCYMNGINDYDYDENGNKKGCSGGGCIPECRFYPATGRIEDEEIIREHEEIEERYRKRNAIVKEPNADVDVNVTLQVFSENE